MNWTHILIHHTAGSDRAGLDTEAIRRFHTEERGWRDIGYNWVVEKVGDVYVAVMGRPMYHAGAHQPGMNRIALGVALVGDFTNDAPPAKQLTTTVRLVAGLAVSLRIPLENIHRHLDHKATECPGNSFPWDAFLGQVEERM